MKIGVVTNPHSRKNRKRRRRAHELRSLLGGAGEVFETRSIDELKPVLRSFRREGTKYWISDGGDGALHWMLRSIMEILSEEGADRDIVTLPMFPMRSGTIDVIANSLGIQRTAEAVLGSLRRSLADHDEPASVIADSMAIDCVQVTAAGEVAFRTYGFVAAVGGLGQQFYTKYYSYEQPTVRTVVEILTKTAASIPVAYTPLRYLPGMSPMLRQYARDMFEPTMARLSVDGDALPQSAYTSIQIASLPIKISHLLRLFEQASQPRMLHAVFGSPSPATALRNLPRMALGRTLEGRSIYNRCCRELVVEATNGELLSPVIDGECYRDLRRITFRLGPRVRVPRAVIVNGAAVNGARPPTGLAAGLRPVRGGLVPMPIR